MRDLGLTPMLKVDLGRLAREGSVLVEARIPADDAIWTGSGLEWGGPVDVRVRVGWAGSGEVVGRGRVTGTLRGECRRCLDPVSTDLDEELTLVFVGDGSDVESEDSGGAYRYQPGAGELDLTQAVREEVVLAMNPYVVCDPECPGLCPMCGASQKDGPCGCSQEETDSRWDTLRKLKS